jgi:hypothetical protein
MAKKDYDPIRDTVEDPCIALWEHLKDACSKVPRDAVQLCMVVPDKFLEAYEKWEAAGQKWKNEQ